MDEAPKRWKGLRWAFRVAAALVSLALILLAIIHTAPVRRYALRRAVETLERAYALRVHADGLSYNVLALRVGLRGVRVAAASSPETPFFSARLVSVQIPRSAILGPFAIESIAVDRGAVRILRTDDRRTNLPQLAGSGGAPDALRLGSLTAPHLAIEISDSTSATSLRLPALDLAISSDSGRLTMRETGRLTRGDVQTRIHEVRGGVSFDGRRLRLSHFAIRTDEIAATVDGALAILVDQPAADLRVTARGEIAQVARWAAIREPPRGAVDVRGGIAGPFSALTIAMTVESSRITWGVVPVTDVAGSVRLTPDRMQIEHLEARLADGRIEARGDVFSAQDIRVIASWDRIDIAGLASMAGLSTPLRPSGRTSGSLEAHGAAGDPRRWVVEARTNVSGGISARNRVAVDGDLDVFLRQAEWGVGTPRSMMVGGLPLRTTLGGAVDFASFEKSTIAGAVELLPTAIRQVADALEQTGVATRDIPALDGSMKAVAELKGTIGRPTIAVDGEVSISEVAPLAPGTPLGGGANLTFHSDLRTAHVSADLPELAALAEGTVDLRAPYNTQVEVVVADLSLERALRGISIPVPITGRFAANGRASGPLQEWRSGRAEVEVESLDAQVGALPVGLEAPARASLHDGIADLGSLELRAGELRVSASGRLPLNRQSAAVAGADALQLTASGDLAQFLKTVAATNLVTLPDVSGTGPAALLARVTGSARQPQISADVELGPGTVQAQDLPPATNVSFRLHSDGTWVELRGAAAEWQGSRVAATGRVPIGLIVPDLASTGAPPGEGRLSARVVSVTPRVLEPFVETETLQQIDGSVDATLELRAGSRAPEDISGELRLDRMDIRLANLPITQREPTRISIRDGFARVDSWRWEGQGGTAGVHGRVRLADRQAALLADGRFDLRMLTPFTRTLGISVAGSLEPRLSITGAIDAPRVDGVASIADGELRLVDPRVIATNLDGRIVLTRTRAQLTSLSGTINGGSLSATGSADYAPGAAIEAAVDVTVQEMALEFPEGLRSELDAVLGLTVVVPAGDEARPAGRLGGTVTVLRGSYREPMAVATGLLATMRSRALAADAIRAPSLADSLALDVRVLTEEDVSIDNNVGRLQLGGDLRVIGMVAAPSLSGRAQLREGGQLFLGRNRYVIESGTIDFANPITIEPELNVSATTRAGGEDISLTIKGTAEHTDVDLRSTSNPDLGQADLASLLLTGRRLDEISGDEAEIVGEQALAYLSGDVLGLASRAVGLDTIRFGDVEESRSADASQLATEIDPTTRLTFGKSVGRDLDVTFSQSLRDSDAQTWIVDYRLRPRVEVRFVSDDENLRSYGFRHDVSFGGISLAQPATPRRQPSARERVGAVTIAGTFPEERLRRVLHLEPDDEFDFVEWQRDRDRIEALLHAEGFYEARVTSRRTTGERLMLVYQIVEGPRCDIQVTGYPIDAATAAALRQAWIEAVFDGFLVDEVEEIVRARLSRDGYLRARIESSMSTNTGRKVLTVRIDPGSRSPKQSIRFEGADRPLAAALEEWAAARESIAGETPGAQATRDPAGFERALTTWLRARGHLRASVNVRPPEIAGDEALVSVRVSAGPVFVVGDVRVEGREMLDAPTVQEVIALSAGEPFDPAAADAARERLQARYRREGFSAARVELRPAIDDETRLVTVTVHVIEGPRQVVREIQVAGNRGIDTGFIARTLDLPVGEPATADAWLQARRRLFDTGLFRRVDVTPEPIDGAPTNGAEQAMRARVTVQEWPALRLRYGFQVAEERPEGEVEGRDLAPGLSADITRRTLFGRALTLGAAADYQRREQSGRGFLTAPALFGLPIESSFIVERSREESTAVTLVTDLTSVSWEQRMRVARNLRISYAYRFERNRTFDTAADPDDEFAFDLTVTVASLNGAVAWDTRDDVADTSRGWLLSSSLDYAPAGLGTDFRFIKYLGQAYFFRPWRRLVIASAARLGAAAPLGGQDLAPSERFFAGGARTVRGVDDETLGPRSALGDPAGGESLLVLNQEARFPLYRWLRGVAFVDAGNVFAETSGINPGDLVGSYGFGLRLATPFALFRVDYGRLFSPQPGTRRGRWIFGIGQAF